jgi:hypothetical protein
MWNSQACDYFVVLWVVTSCSPESRGMTLFRNVGMYQQVLTELQPSTPISYRLRKFSFGTHYGLSNTGLAWNYIKLFWLRLLCFLCIIFNWNIFNTFRDETCGRTKRCDLSYMCIHFLDTVQITRYSFQKMKSLRKTGLFVTPTAHQTVCTMMILMFLLQKYAAPFRKYVRR